MNKVLRKENKMTVTVENYEDSLLVGKLDKDSEFVFCDDDVVMRHPQEIHKVLHSSYIETINKVDETISNLEKIKDKAYLSIYNFRDNSFAYDSYGLSRARILSDRGNYDSMTKEEAEQAMEDDFMEMLSYKFMHDYANKDKKDYQFVQARIKSVRSNDSYARTLASLSQYFYHRRINYLNLSPLELCILVDLSMYFVYESDFVFSFTDYMSRDRRIFEPKKDETGIISQRDELLEESYVQYVSIVIDTLRKICGNNVYKTISMMGFIVDYLQNKQFDNDNDNMYADINEENYVYRKTNGLFFEFVAPRFKTVKHCPIYSDKLSRVDFFPLREYVENCDISVFDDVDVETLFNLYVKAAVVPLECELSDTFRSQYSVDYDNEMKKFLEVVTK